MRWVPTRHGASKTFAGTTRGRHGNVELCKSLPYAGAGDRETWLLETLVGMRVTVALGSRTPRRIQDLCGNDEEGAQERRVMQRSPFAGAGDRETWLLETLVGMRVTVALGSRLRGNDEGAARERRVMQRSPAAGKTRGDDVP